MKRITLLICAGLIVLMASAQPNTKVRPSETVLLYGTELVDNMDPIVGKTVTAAGFKMETDNGVTGPENIDQAGTISNISGDSRFDLYFPKKPNGQMVLVCPGGAYMVLATYNEGIYVADWMLSKGYTVAVLKHRLPNGHWEVPLEDVHNAFRYCREHAEEWGVSQIGIIGFSAGGHLAASATTLFTDDVTRPDFSVLVYPVITMEDGITHRGTKEALLGSQKLWDDKTKSVQDWEADMAQYSSLVETYSTEKQITKNTPPTFLFHCGNDRVVPVENSLRFYRNMVANGAPAELHVVPTGSHGWGFVTEKISGRDSIGYCREEFFTSLDRWLTSLR